MWRKTCGLLWLLFGMLPISGHGGAESSDQDNGDQAEAYLEGERPKAVEPPAVTTDE